jgi:hypothetical protein
MEMDHTTVHVPTMNDDIEIEQVEQRR